MYVMRLPSLLDTCTFHGQAPPRRRTGVTATNNGQAEEDPQDNAGAGGPRRRLGVCQGEAHALMLEEMLKGANVVISGDSGKMVHSCLPETTPSA